ncbi:amidase family protein [Mycobacterium pseudoshottsii]|uniref:amidase family protein n=1 Tax=Mycobacterium pseudoshottsii TaxID=265949 RepID=UPI00076E5101|nr:MULTISPECIES: amidase family protein [Mycobacterium ulcerans group]MBC9865550.1 putative secreted amidase [Mycobacterium pseudoshottsii]RFZ63790.1 amidase [Mycobacterium marinum]GAQ32756.1 peptide amidase, GatA_1 [Mycobacterium pseudoshottsii JCM 15466]
MELPEFTIAETQTAFERGEWTAAGLTDCYLRRIREIDQSGPMLRSIIEVNPDALAIAEALDAERSGGRIRGALHGVPVVIKDSIDNR